MIRRHLPTVNWKVYFNDNENPRAKKFLETRGYELFTQIGANIVRAKRASKTEVIFLAHPNAFSIVSVPEKEYTEFLNFALKWFQDKEQYEYCTKVVNWKNKLKQLELKATNLL
jgi:hypothetical protein